MSNMKNKRQMDTLSDQIQNMGNSARKMIFFLQ